MDCGRDYHSYRQRSLEYELRRCLSQSPRIFLTRDFGIVSSPARIFAYSPDRTNGQLIALEIIRASCARCAMLRERLAIGAAEFAVSIGANQPDELTARHLVTRHIIFRLIQFDSSAPEP